MLWRTNIIYSYNGFHTRDLYTNMLGKRILSGFPLGQQGLTFWLFEWHIRLSKTKVAESSDQQEHYIVGEDV